MNVYICKGPVAQWIERPPPKRQVGRPIRPRIKGIRLGLEYGKQGFTGFPVGMAEGSSPSGRVPLVFVKIP